METKIKPPPHYLDGDYPTDEATELIRSWDDKDLRGCFAFIRSIWWAADWGWSEPEDGVYHISTGGWSGNEDLIAAMEANTMLMMLCWQQSRRGGHHIFELPKYQRAPNPAPDV